MELLKNFSFNKTNTFLEFSIVTISLISILVLIRIISKSVFDDNWIGSLGMVSAIFGLLLFLAKKEKLGFFGHMFIRQITKNYHGKKKWFIYAQTGFFLSIGLLTIFSIHTGNTEFANLKEQVITHLNSEGMLIDSEINYETLNQLSSQISIEQQIQSIVNLPSILIGNFVVFSVVLSVTNELLGGWVMFFWQVMIIETIEIICFVYFARKYLRSNLIQN